MKKKILIINWQDWTNPLSGGAEVHLNEIFKRLTDRYEIFLLCSGYEGSKKEETVNDIKIFRKGSRNTFNFHVPSEYRRLSSLIDFNLVIEDLNKIPFFGNLYVREKRMGIVHHLFGESIYLETNPIFASYVYFTERLIPKFYSDIPMVSVSESTKSDLVEMGMPAENIEVIYNGVDLSNYRISDELFESPTCVCLGRMKKYKKMDILLNALPEVKRKIPDLKVIFVGTGDYLPRLRKKAEENNLMNVVEFKGFVSEEEKINILSHSWVAVNTSPKEGWGLTSIEAQASGTPSVVPDSPGLRETVKDKKSGYIYPYGEVEILSDILIDILSDEQKVMKMGRRAREWASNFSWEKSARKMAESIERITE